MRRDRLGMMFNVLNAIGNGTDRYTRIMQAANLNAQTCDEILNDLVSRKLITEERAHRLRRYHATDKGLGILWRYEAFLKAYRNSGKDGVGGD